MQPRRRPLARSRRFTVWVGQPLQLVDIKTTAADIAHLGGALMVTVSEICMGEVVRIGRYMNILLALVVAVGPWIVGPSGTNYAIACRLIAVVVLSLSIRRGPKTQTYGAWDRYVR